jgi:ribosomal protein S14
MAPTNKCLAQGNKSRLGNKVTKAVMGKATSTVAESFMSRFENRCANCGGKFGLIHHEHWGLRFCRKACKTNFLARTVRDHAWMRKWFGLVASPPTCSAIARKRAL